MAKVALWVRCHNCGYSFDSGLRLDQKSFERGTLAANYHTCPRCAARETYRKADYELREAPLVRGSDEKMNRRTEVEHRPSARRP